MFADNELQKDESLKFSEPNDTSVVQTNAANITRLYGRMIMHFEENLAAWAAFQKTVTENSATANAFTNDQSFRDLVAMGPAIIPLVMIKYANDINGWWHELLYQIENHNPSTAGTWNKNDLFKEYQKRYAYEDFLKPRP